jgi:hypothetical protein
MASLLTTAQKAIFQKGLNDLFDTFKQDIVVYKDAQIELINVNQPRTFGYNERVDISNINFAPVTGVFSALVNFNSDQKQNYLNEVGNLIPKGDVSIKVKNDAYDFIENNGATLNISINDTLYKITSSESFRRYITPDYYTYYLERVR